MKSKTRNRFSTVAAVGLIAIGIYVLVGCIPLPGNFKPRPGLSRPETKIGKPSDEKQPLRLKVSTRDQVISILGTPYLASADGSAVIYSYEVNTHSLFWPLCFFMGAQKEYNLRFLLIQFGEDQTLRSYKVDKDLAALRRRVRSELSQPPRTGSTSRPHPGVSLD